jgi:hypothetical protein
MIEIYIPTEQYRAAVNAIAVITGIDTDEIKIALGGGGNIWPASIREIDLESGRRHRRVCASRSGPLRPI